MSDRSQGKQAMGRPDYIPTLDGWRAVAISVVMAQHVSDQVTRVFGDVVEPVTSEFKSHGRMGVQIFFAISGYLICSRLLADERRTGRFDLGEFYLRRAFRILPPLVVVLTVFGILGLRGVIPMPLRDWLGALLFANNYVSTETWYLGHFWSLAIEEHFYLIWPPILVFFGRHRTLRISIMLVVAVSIWRYIDLAFELTADTNTSIGTRTDTQFDGLMWGCILAIACLDLNRRARVATLMRGARYWGVAVLLVLTQFFDTSQPVVQAVQMALRPILIVLLVAGTVFNPWTRLGQLLEIRPLRWIGRISYSLYLWQQLFLAWDGYDVDGLEAVQWFPMSIVCAILVAAASHRFVERPMIRLGKRLADKRRARLAPSYGRQDSR